MLLTEASNVLGVLLPIVHRKSKYFPQLLLLVCNDLLTKVLRGHGLYENIVYVFMGPIILMTIIPDWYKKKLYVFLGIALAFGISFIPLFLGRYSSLYIMFVWCFLLSMFYMLLVIKQLMANLRIPLLELALFLYLFSPVLRLYLLFSGTRLSEYYYVVALGFEALVAFGMLFLRETNPKHAIYLRKKENVQQ